jgi:hypothetical protein
MRPIDIIYVHPKGQYLVECLETGWGLQPLSVEQLPDNFVTYEEVCSTTHSDVSTSQSTTTNS